MSRSLRIAFSVLISLVLLYFAARGVEWDKALQAMANAHYIYLAPMLALSLLTLYIRAQRWRLLLQPIGRPAMRSLVDATNIGLMANMVLPLRMGEVIRPVLLSRRENEPLGGILATIVVERVFDLFTVVLLFGISATTVGVTARITQWGYRLFVVAAVMAAAVLFVRWQEALALRLLHTVLSPLPARFAAPIEEFFSGFVKALEILDSPSIVARLVGWSLYLWFVIAAVFGVGMVAFDLPVPVFVAAIVVTAITAIAVSAPSAPGFIGAFQLGCTLGLGIFAVAESNAFAFSIVVHVTQFVATIGAGLYSMTRGGMSFRQLEEVAATDASRA